jgi:hypothetical protein
MGLVFDTVLKGRNEKAKYCEKRLTTGDYSVRHAGMHDARPPSHRYRSKVRYRTATDYGPGICIRVRIPYRTVRIRI